MIRAVLAITVAVISGCAGEFEAFRLEYDRHRPQVVAVESPYAILILWQEPDSIPQFHFYDKRARRHLVTESWDLFLAEMSRVPEGTTVQRYFTCGAPFEYAMPEDKSRQLESLVKFTYTLVCTCESTRFRVPT